MIKAQNQTDKICGTIADKQNQPIVMANVVALDPTILIYKWHDIRSRWKFQPHSPGE